MAINEAIFPNPNSNVSNWTWTNSPQTVVKKTVTETVEYDEEGRVTKRVTVTEETSYPHTGYYTIN